MLAGLLGLALLASFAPVTAHESPNHGTIKVHDEESVDPEERNQPHVCSPFWIQGFDMTDGSGELVFYAWPPTGDKEEVLRVDWTGTGSEEDGYAFNHGPLSLDAGHYRVEAFVDDAEPHPQGHSTKSKTFWVECAEGDGDGGPKEEDRPMCPTDLLAVAEANGSVTLTWTAAVADVNGYNVYRSEGGDDFDLVAQVDADTTGYVDTTTVVGVTYTYTVTAFNNDLESEGCEEVEVTAIPDFPTVMGFGLAAASGLLAYALRRRS